MAQVQEEKYSLHVHQEKLLREGEKRIPFSHVRRWIGDQQIIDLARLLEVDAFIRDDEFNNNISLEEFGVFFKCEKDILGCIVQDISFWDRALWKNSGWWILCDDE